MIITVNNKIRISDPIPAIERYCREKLIFDNPEYIKKVRSGRWIGNTPSKIWLYESYKGDLILPFGCLLDIFRLAPNAVYKPQFAPIRRLEYKSAINLYRYQEEAAKKAISARNGVLVMPCGSGKTQTAFEIISRIGGTCLWLTHTYDLLNQSMNRAKSVLGIDAGTYGTITGGKINIGKGITFATVQTMVNIDLSEYQNAWDIIVVDECHKAVGSPTKMMQFYKVISSLSARYKFGLTATPKRSDGLEKSMFALIGGIIHEVTKDDVKETTCPVKVKVVKTDYFPNEDRVLLGDGTLNYASLVDDLTHDSDRFDKVFDEIKDLKGGAIVLANRVEYLTDLCRAYTQGQWGEAVCLSNMGASARAKKARKDALVALNDGELDCVFATYQLAKEGLDVPNLRYLVLATPEKDETTVMQSVGRVSRKAEGKEFGTVIDFDDSFGMYKGWLKKRMGYYKKLDAEIL